MSFLSFFMQEKGEKPERKMTIKHEKTEHSQKTGKRKTENI